MNDHRTHELLATGRVKGYSLIFKNLIKVVKETCECSPSLPCGWVVIVCDAVLLGVPSHSSIILYISASAPY